MAIKYKLNFTVEREKNPQKLLIHPSRTLAKTRGMLGVGGVIRHSGPFGFCQCQNPSTGSSVFQGSLNPVSLNERERNATIPDHYKASRTSLNSKTNRNPIST